jgi:hypothetical protein
MSNNTNTRITPRLRGKVAAVNAANAIANTILTTAPEILRPFVGEVVINASGTLRKKFADALQGIVEKVKPEKNANVYVEASRYSVHLRVWADEFIPEPIEGHPNYGTSARGEQSATVGWIDYDGKLKAYDAVGSHRTDYTAEEVVALRVKLGEARDRVNQITNDLTSFAGHE